MKHENLIHDLESLSLFLRAHPDCVTDSEMAGQLQNVEDMKIAISALPDETLSIKEIRDEARRCFLGRDQDEDAFYIFSGRLQEVWSQSMIDSPF